MRLSERLAASKEKRNLIQALKAGIRLLAVFLSLSVAVAQSSALAANDKEKTADAAKPSAPLGDKDNPLLIGKRDINKD